MRIPLDDLSALRFQAASLTPLGTVHVYLADGGQVVCTLLRSDRDAVVVRTTVFEELVLPFERLAGIRWGDVHSTLRASELFHNALAKRLPAEDVLISIGSDSAKTLRGRVERLDATGGSFVFGGRSRSFLAEKALGVVFAAGAAPGPSAPASIVLADGSRFSGRVIGGDRETIRVDGSLGHDVSVPVSAISAVELRSPRLVYLSDLSAMDQKIEGRLHRPWPVRYDRNVANHTLSLGGQAFNKGIGVHSYTSLTFAIGGAFERFLATIGIDDAVRPNGSVLFRVLGDGKVLFDSGIINGTDDPEDLNVDVAGVDQLTLEVDYGNSWDLSDHADWAEARLIKPSTGNAE